jgi:four helix bundle protein
MPIANSPAPIRSASAQRKHDLLARTRAYALRIIRLYSALPKSTVSQVIGKQVLRSGTSVGAHVAEAIHAKSRPDFTCKIDGAIQELEETRYWLYLLSDAELLSIVRLQGLQDETDELMSIFVTMVKKTRQTKV